MAICFVFISCKNWLFYIVLFGSFEVLKLKEQNKSMRIGLVASEMEFEVTKYPLSIPISIFPQAKQLATRQNVPDAF